MDSDPHPRPQATTFVYDAAHRLTVLGDPAGPGPQAQPPPQGPPPEHRAAPFDFEHDKAKGIFRIHWAEGKTEVFRDNPVRYLVVEPDAATGAMKPVLKRGAPTYLDLCREEREIR